MDIALIGNWNETRATHGLAKHWLVPPGLAVKSPREVNRYRHVGGERDGGGGLDAGGEPGDLLIAQADRLGLVAPGLQDGHVDASCRGGRCVNDDRGRCPTPASVARWAAVVVPAAAGGLPAVVDAVTGLCCVVATKIALNVPVRFVQ